MDMIQDHDSANRLARAIASDIALYNEEKIRQGILDDNVFDVLTAEIDQGRKHYQSKVMASIQNKKNYFDRALVDVLLKRKAHIESPIW